MIVEDDGIGMDESMLDRLEAKVSSLDDSEATSSSHTGIGLVNVNKRIKAKYGGDYGLTIRSALGKGTIVIISLPYESS